MRSPSFNRLCRASVTNSGIRNRGLQVRGRNFQIVRGEAVRQERLDGVGCGHWTVGRAYLPGVRRR